MSANFIGPRKRGWEQLFTLIENELRHCLVENVRSELLVAIAVNASQGNGYFCCSMKNYRAEMNRCVEVQHFQPRLFLERIVPKTGFRRGQVPKFAFDESQYLDARRLVHLFSGDTTDGVIFASNWGLFQMPARQIGLNLELASRREYLQAFQGDLNMQVREMAYWFDARMKNRGKVEREVLFDFHFLRGFDGKGLDRVDRDLALADALSGNILAISSV